MTSFMARCRARAGSLTSARVHMALAIVWGVMVVPTVLWWRDSVLFVAGASLYANVVAHLGAYQASKAEQAASGE